MIKLIICICIVIISFILMGIISIYNNLQYLKIKLDKANVNIDNALENKYLVLIRFIDLLLKNELITENDFSSFKELNYQNINIFKLDKEIIFNYNEIKKILAGHEKLLRNESFINIDKDLLNLDIIINSCKKYYNDNLTIYNKRINCFPSRLIAKIFKFKEKDFYSEEKEDSLKILEE